MCGDLGINITTQTTAEPRFQGLCPVTVIPKCAKPGTAGVCVSLPQPPAPSTAGKTGERNKPELGSSEP